MPHDFWTIFGHCATTYLALALARKLACQATLRLFSSPLQKTERDLAYLAV